jgi:hypothetical protein
MINENGEDVFKELKSPNSRWNNSHNVLFVVRVEDGTFLVYPGPSVIGHDASFDINGINGKPFAQLVIRRAKSRKEGSWLRHFEDIIAPQEKLQKGHYTKLTQCPEGHQYAIAVGRDGYTLEQYFVSELVNEACELIKKKGRKGFEDLRRENSFFRFRDTYVFVYDDKGVLLVHPLYPTLEGRNLSDWKDADDFQSVRAILKKAMSESEGGWVSHGAIKPGDKYDPKDRSNERPKLTFVKKVTIPEGVFIMGAGVYLDVADKSGENR